MGRLVLLLVTQRRQIHLNHLMQPRNALLLDALHSCHGLPELDSLWFVCDSSRQQSMAICMFCFHLSKYPYIQEKLD